MPPDTIPADREHPYAPSVLVGDTAYVSGALSVDTDGGVVTGARPALDAALARLTERLATVGLGLTDVVKLTYFVTDISTRDEANEQMMEVFAAPRPARSFVEVSGLPYGASVEIEAIAHRASAR